MEIDWKQHIQAWQESGLSQKEYCLEKHLDYNSFYNARRRNLRSQKQEEARNWIPVRVEEKVEKATSINCEIRMELAGVSFFIPLTALKDVFQLIKGK